jgi:hypothetical protein
MSVDPYTRAISLAKRRGETIPETLRAYLFTSPGVYAWEEARAEVSRFSFWPPSGGQKEKRERVARFPCPRHKCLG